MSATKLDLATQVSGTLAAANLPASGVTAASYGSSDSVPVVTFDAKGRATTAAQTLITINAATGIVSGTLPTARGGTGLPTYVQGDIIFASATNVLASLPKSATASRYLSNTGTANAPAWAQINLPDGVTGTLAVAHGGTGSATALGDGNVMQSSSGALVESTVAIGPLARLIAAPVALGTSSIVAMDVSATTVYTLTMSQNMEIVPTNFSDGMKMDLVVTAPGAFAISWDNVAWVGGAAPTQTPNGVDVYSFLAANGTIYGSVVQNLAGP